MGKFITELESRDSLRPDDFLASILAMSRAQRNEQADDFSLPQPSSSLPYAESSSGSRLAPTSTPAHAADATDVPTVPLVESSATEDINMPSTSRRSTRLSEKRQRTQPSGDEESQDISTEAIRRGK